MSNNISYSVWINYDKLGDNELDMIEYQFDNLEDVKRFKELLPELKLDYKNIYYDMFIFNIKKVYELDDNLQPIK